MGFRFSPRSMTSEFLGISRISDATAVKRMKIGQYCQRQRCRHVELEQFWQAFASRGFVSDSWAFLFCHRCRSIIPSCFTSTIRLFIDAFTGTPPAADWKRPLAGPSTENLASTGGRRYGSTHQCLSIRNPGPFVVEIAIRPSAGQAQQ